MRDHQLFHQPNQVDITTTIPAATPEVWKGAVTNQETPVIPLVKETKRGSFEKWSQKYQPGWVVYYANTTLSDSPEVEIFCNGLNVKTYTGAALWRQGNLFHFNFDVSPEELNEAGKALLLNAIVYISRFSEDRPIVFPPGGWQPNQVVFRSRLQLDQVFKKTAVDPRMLDYYLASAVMKTLTTNDMAALKNWYNQNRPFLYPGADGRLEVDADALKWNTPCDTLAFFERAIQALRGLDADCKIARRMLSRYAPEGPGVDASAEVWEKWWLPNRDYLFFCDSGGGRWYLDPLAKKRGIPTAELRGPSRATLP